MRTRRRAVQRGRVRRAGANRMESWLTVLAFCSLLTAQEPDRMPATTVLGVEVEHRVVLVKGSPYPATITKPSAPGKHPAVFLIAGLGCYSLESLAPDDPYNQLLEGLTLAGFVTMRVDKIPARAEDHQKQGPPCDS